MPNIAIIPARGGSKRIPKKNINIFLGKPIIAYSIETALKSGLFDEVMVSTDNEEIAKISIEYGASVPFLRSQKNADDYATLADVIDEVVAQYSNQNKTFDYACCILPTSPLMTIERLNEGLELLKSESFDSVRPIVRFSYPIQRAIKLSGSQIEMFYPEHAKTRSQDLEEAYHDAGQFYWFKFKQGLQGVNKGAIKVSEIEVQDIDCWDDWRIAEYKYRFLNDKF